MSYPDWLNEIIRRPETGETLTPSDNAYLRADGKRYPIVDGILSSSILNLLLGKTQA